MDYVINALVNFLLYISIPIAIRYLIVREPIKKRWLLIAILLPIFIGFSVLINIQRDDAQKNIYQKYNIPYKPQPHILGSGILYGAMALSYAILRRENNKPSEDEAPKKYTNAEKLYEAVLGEKNSAYYLSKFQKFDQQPSGLQSSWNLCAWFFSGLWALYRKMYGWFFVFWGIAATAKLLEKAVPESSLIFLVSSIIFGIFADSLYHHSVKKKIAAAQLTIKYEAQLIEFLRKKGGVNTWVIWVFGSLPVVGIVLSIAIPAFVDHKIINKAPTGVEFIFYLLIVLAIIFAVYTHWFKKETPQKYINTDWKKTKPQTTSEKTESIPSSQLYEIIAEEMDRKEYKKGLATRAFAEANGDKEVAKSLYIKFRYAELFSQMELERKEKQRQQQMEDERIERERANKHQQKQKLINNWTAFDWAVIGICSVALVVCIWIFYIKPESTPTTNIPPSTVTSVPAQSVPQTATPQDIPQRANDLYKQGRYAEAFSLYQGLAEQGDANAQTFLGFMYANGRGVAKDEAQAIVWYRKAAEQGDATAQFSLGVMYYADGLGVAKDKAQAVVWFRKAAELGYADAQANLGFMYANGQGVTKDEAQAVVWFRKAAEQGLARAQSRLGLMYENGVGIAKNYNQALYWYNKAAEQGYAWGQYNLGAMYMDGAGVAQDYNQAVFWFNKAAEQGDADGQYQLGFMYYYGKGVTQDYNQAVILFRKAAQQGNANAIAALKN